MLAAALLLYFLFLSKFLRNVTLTVSFLRSFVLYSYVAYGRHGLVPLLVTLSVLQRHFGCLKPF